jgi:CheY-like chemotaxis protein
VLIVEDERIIASDLQLRLTRLGYAVTGVVSTGAAAVAHAVAERPDLILMDMGLAGELDGVEAAHRIRAHASIPVIFLTAHADDASRRRAEATRPAAYLLKPYETRELRRALDAVFAPAPTPSAPDAPATPAP